MTEEEKITKQQVQDYISENFDSFFVDALAKYIRDVIFPEPKNEEDVEEYREELKQLVWDGISNGFSKYLSSDYHEGGKELSSAIAQALLEDLFSRKVSIKLE